MLHRETSNWDHKLNDTTFLDSFIDPQTHPSRKQLGGRLQSPTCTVSGFISQTTSTVRYPADLLSSAFMRRNQQSKGGGYVGNKGNQSYTSGGSKTKTVDAATALGLGPLPQQNTMLSGLARLNMAQQSPLDSRFGSVTHWQD